MKELRELTKPVVQWLRDNYDPYFQIVIESHCVRMDQSVMEFPVVLPQD